MSQVKDATAISIFVVGTGIMALIGAINVFGGLVSGVWLAVLGQWWAIALGVLVIVIGPLFISLILMPALILAVPSSKVLAAGKIKTGIILGLPSCLYTIGIMIGWCYGVFQVFDDMADESSRIPMLIWSYGVACGPWYILAKGESNRRSSYDPAGTYAFSVSMGYLLMIFTVLVLRLETIIALIGLCAVMAISFIFLLVSIPRPKEPKPVISSPEVQD